MLNKLGFDCRAERTAKKRPDIKCYYKGLIIGIESSYKKVDAEYDAMKRIDEKLADISIALWIKEKFRDVPEKELEELIEKGLYDVKVFVARELQPSLIEYLLGKIPLKKPEPATGWFTDIDLPFLKVIIDNSVEFLISEEEVEKMIQEMKARISEFVNSAGNIDRGLRGSLRDRIYGILYKLYGLSVSEARDEEVLFGQAALSILLSATFYEYIREHASSLRSDVNLYPLQDYIRTYGSINGMLRALRELLKVNYKGAIKTAIDILESLPIELEIRIKNLAELGAKIASKRFLLKKDFAGRLYHEITGDIALRKGFATFFTEVPAAYLLAALAINVFLNLEDLSVPELSKEKVIELINKISEMKVGDFACGSGTLLTASYYILHRLITALRYYHDIKSESLQEINKEFIEKAIYGIDALKYASQITAINLALISTPLISHENIYTIYLGYLPEKGQSWLGSLELLRDGKRVGGLLAYIEKGLQEHIERISLKGEDKAFLVPSRFDIIIMNPPFTRATGRGQIDFKGRSRGLFGFIVEESARDKLLKDFRNYRNAVRKDLKSLAASTLLFDKSIPRLFKDLLKGEIEIKRDKALKQYLNIGQAGEGLLFLHLAYKYVKDNGVIAFVLPKGLLAGISWFLARALLASKFHLKYIIVSSDPNKGYNFSEGASFSECLIVAKKVRAHDEHEETVFINLLQKPSTALESVILAEEIKRYIKSSDKTAIIKACKSIALASKVDRQQLLNNIDNWNRLCAFLSPQLNETVMRLYKGDILGVTMPMTRLGDIVDVVGLAVRRGTFHDVFEHVDIRLPDSIPALIGGEERLRKTILVKPNAWVRCAKPQYLSTAAKFLVPDRIWIDTTRAIALFSKQPLVASMFFGLKPRERNVTEMHLKALTLWFNTIWGILSILAERTETRGRWIELTITKWKQMPIIDVSSLSSETLKRLVKVFDECAIKELKRLPQQFNPKNPDPIRLHIDIGFLKALNPHLNEKAIKRELLQVYGYLNIALKQWIGS